LAHRLAFCVEKSPELARLIEAWPTLPPAIRTGIVAMVNASQ
jgi:hypothetical protein